MKPIYKHLTMLTLVAGGLSSCIEETFPEDSTLTSGQVATSATALNSFATGIAGFFGQYGTCYSSSQYDLGYPGLGLIRDIYCEDMSINSTEYEYFYWWAATTYLGENNTTCYFPWAYYYKLISNTHNILRSDYNEVNKAYFGIAHYYRAWAYFDLARMFEYKKTGVDILDQQAENNEIYRLTVPIITEQTTEEEARNTPRAPFYEMYKFIMDDLDKAESYLDGYTRPTKNLPNLAAVYGMKARLYLEMGTRFYNTPADYDKVKAASVDLGVNGYEDAFRLAADYARKAITISGATPLSESEWYGGSDYTQGFNTVNSNAWILGAIISKENLSVYAWNTFVGMISIEQNYGVGGYNTYGAQRTIGKALFDKISDSDWRKTTWIAPADAGTAATKKYRTILDTETFQSLPAYSSFKFRPKAGNMTDYSVSAAADYPLMRVEEMYFIEAEAKAYTSLTDGIIALENFMNTYRYTDGSYICNAGSLTQFLDALMLQKRIEFWGEGIIYWDYKRLNRQVVRGYSGTNFPEAYRFNSIAGYCAPWMTVYIPNNELGLNTAMRPNPDPTKAIPLWTE